MAAAFIGESQARNRYNMYAKIAKKEGYEQLSAIFADTADQEREHAKQLMKMINKLQEESGRKEEIKVAEAGVPTVEGTTAENLAAAIAGENYETMTMYPGFADEAEQEGLADVATRLRAIGRAEARHKERYEKLLKEVKAGTMFKKGKETVWFCRKCGYVHVGPEAPEACPSCGHPQSYFQVQCEEY